MSIQKIYSHSNLRDFMDSDKEYIVEILEEILDDSMDIDWNTRVGADRITDFLVGWRK